MNGALFVHTWRAYRGRLLVVTIGLLLWGVAAIVSNNRDDTTDNLAPSFQEMGSAQFVAQAIAASLTRTRDHR